VGFIPFDHEVLFPVAEWFSSCPPWEAVSQFGMNPSSFRKSGGLVHL